MTDWSSQVGTLELFARRLSFFSRTVMETQTLLGVEGNCDQPWTEEYQQRAVEIYQLTLPPFYLSQLASSFAGVVLILDHRFGEEAHDYPWSILRSYFWSAKTAIGSALGVTILPSSGDPNDKRPTTPGAVRFDLIAQDVERRAIRNQMEAADSAVSCLAQAKHSTLRADYRAWLTHLAGGGTVVDLAAIAGYSERSMYRLLKQMWRDLGVDNLRQGVALAVENGWLDASG